MFGMGTIGRHVRLIAVMLVVLLAAAGGVANATPARAALVKTWTGATNANWNTATNWNPAVTPQDGEQLSFPQGASNRAMVDDLGRRVFVAGIDIHDTYTFTSATTEDIALTGALTADGGLGVQFGIPIVLQGGSTSIGGAVPIVASAPIGETGGPQHLTVQSNVTLGAANTFTGGLTFGGSNTVALAAAVGTGPVQVAPGSLTLASGTYPNAFTIDPPTNGFGTTIATSGAATTVLTGTISGSARFVIPLNRRLELQHVGFAPGGSTYDVTGGGELTLAGRLPTIRWTI